MNTDEIWDEALSYCWAFPRGWDDGTPDKPRCNRPRGHEGQHVMHVEWRDSDDVGLIWQDASEIPPAWPGGLR